jgi:hypothetical protein
VTQSDPCGSLHASTNAGARALWFLLLSTGFLLGCTDSAASDACTVNWDCGAASVCIDGGCSFRLDEPCEPEGCGSRATCIAGICEAAMGTFGPVAFERFEPGDIAAHAPDWGADSWWIGVGAALLDWDGDGDVDIFMATHPNSPVPPCLYENVSEPGQPVFRKIDALCSRYLGDVRVAGSIRFDDDEADSILMMGPGRMTLVRPDGRSSEVLGSAHSGCQPAAAMPVDIDLDGRLDLVVACHHGGGDGDGDTPSSVRGLAAMRNLVFLGQSDDSFVEASAAEHGLEESASTLALGIADLDRDGLLDLVVVNDNESEPWTVNPFLDPGGVYRTCAPDEDCGRELFLLGEGLSESHGAFMGVGLLEVDGRGEHLFLTDLGPNRAVAFLEGGPTNVAQELGISGPESELLGGPLWLSWGVAVDDFDGNGLDDVFVTNGLLPPPFRGDVAEMVNTLFLQRAGGDFSLQSDVGFASFAASGGLEERASRAALRADFDRNGRLDLFVTAAAGPPAFYEVSTSSNRWCTLEPVPAYVPSHGYGYTVRDERTEFSRRRDMQGQVGVMAPRTIVVDTPRGHLTFPSGAEVPFDCNDGASVVVVEEPLWLEFETEGSELRVTISKAWPGPRAEATIAARNADGDVTVFRDIDVESGTFRAAVGDATEVMLRLDERWVGRWFEI